MTTARQCYEGALVELNKVNAPSLLLEDFNYLFNKVIYQYINKRYNIYDMNQQTTDDLSMLSTTANLTAKKKPVTSNVTSKDSYFNATYEFTLPSDYLHLLNCICTFKVNKPFKCYTAGSYIQFPATRLTSDLWAQAIRNVYLRPSYRRPYYFIHNINTTPSKNVWSKTKPDYLNVISDTINFPADLKVSDVNTVKVSELTDVYGNRYMQQAPTPKRTQTVNDYQGFKKTGQGNIVAKVNNENLVLGTITQNSNGSVTSKLDPSIVKNFGNNVITMSEGDIFTGITLVDGTEVNAQVEFEWEPINNEVVLNGVEKVAGMRSGPANNVRLEIRYGKDNELFTLECIDIDYLKIPQYVEITQEQLDTVEDTSQIMEYPDYICQEIINELVHVIMENTSNPRLQTHIPVTQSIASPVQQQQTTKK